MGPARNPFAPGAGNQPPQLAGRDQVIRQEWGYHTWHAAKQSPIDEADVHFATADALLQLDSDFFRVRFDRLTATEKEYMRAMGELGPGPHTSGDVAKAMGKRTSAVGPLRDSLSKKGMIYSPSYGIVAFTVPMFDAFMRRTMPEWKPPPKPQ